MSQEEIIQIAMQVILHAGNARNIIREGANQIINNQLDNVNEMISSAKKELIEAHQIQTKMLQQEANQHNVEVTVLFTHAQDVLMTTESELFFIETLYGLEGKRGIRK